MSSWTKWPKTMYFKTYFCKQAHKQIQPFDVWFWRYVSRGHIFKSKKKFSSMVIKFQCHKVSMVIKFKRVASLRHPLIIDQILHLMICHSLKTGNYCLILREPGNYGLISWENQEIIVFLISWENHKDLCMWIYAKFVVSGKVLQE